VPRLFSSAAYRLAFTYTAVCALAILLLGFGVYLAAGRAMQGQQDEDLRNEVAVLSKKFDGGSADELIGAIQRRETSPNNHFVYALYKDGRRIAGHIDGARASPGFSTFQFNDPGEGPDTARGMLAALPDGMQLLVAIDTEDLERLDSTILSLFAVAFVLVVALGIAGSLALGAHLRQRLVRISTTAEAIALGDLTRRIERSGGSDEFDRVDASLNAMLDRITALLENLRQVSSDLAHDLRTPLTRLRAEIETALHRNGDPDASRTALQQALEQSDAILSLFSAMLRIAEVEGGAVTSGFRQMDAGALVTSVGEMYGPALEDGGRSLHCSVDPSLMISGHRELLMQALGNLLDNTQSHTPRGTRVSLTARRAPDGICICVADDGAGIADEDRERVVRRFVRLDPSRSGAGHGLGLNFVAAVVRTHAGTLRLEDARPGLAVLLTLPALAMRGGA